LAGHVPRKGEKGDAYMILVGKPEGKRPLERPRCRWDDTNKIGLREIGCGSIYCVGLAQNRV
jgi:hypothetical protein